MKKSMQEQPGLSGKFNNYTVLVTANCNLRCDYCYISKKPRQMNIEIADKSLDFIFRESDNSTRISITFFGGEPLMAPVMIEYICKRALERAATDNRELSFSMTTNGTLVNKRNAELIRKYDVKTKLSIDGIGESQDRHRKQVDGAGSFDLIAKNIDNILSLPGLTVRMTVTPDTVTYLADSVRWLSQKGFRHIFFTPVVEADWNELNLSALYDCYQKLSIYQEQNKRGARVSNLARDLSRLRRGNKRIYGCGAAVSMVAIDPEGYLYPCHRFAGYFDSDNDCRIGDVFKGINEERRCYYAEANRIDNYMDCGAGLYLKSTSESNRNCCECKLFPVCHASCIAVNEHMTGKPNVPSPINRILAQISAARSLTLISDGKSKLTEQEC
jgi:uncharacterized protein